jgi:uncharacterized protein HemX
MMAAFDEQVEPQTEERLAHIEGVLEQMDKRLGNLEASVRDLQGRVADKWLVAGGIAWLSLLMWLTR